MMKGTAIFVSMIPGKKTLRRNQPKSDFMSATMAAGSQLFFMRRNINAIIIIINIIPKNVMRAFFIQT